MSIDALKPFWGNDPQEWDHWMKTNFFGVLNCCRAIVPGMISRRRGRIIAMISDAARVGEPHLAVYSGAKAGAAGFMRSLARVVAPFEITANCVALGATRTPRIASMIEDTENVKKMLRGYLIRRLGEPDDAAAMIPSSPPTLPPGSPDKPIRSMGVIHPPRDLFSYRGER